jgi:hypothetical protein
MIGSKKIFDPLKQREILALLESDRVQELAIQGAKPPTSKHLQPARL